MNIRVRIFGLVAAVVVLAMALSLWKYISLNNTVQTEVITQMVERDAAAIRQLTELAARNLRERLFEQVTREQTGRHLGLSATTEEELERSLSAGPFLAVALLKFEKEKWDSAWSRQRSNIAARWPDGFLKGILRDLPVEGAIGENMVWMRVTDRAQQPVFLLMVQMRDGNENVIAIGFLPSSALSPVTDAFAGTGVEALVVDERGFALAYGEQAYVGASLSESHPAITEVLRRREVAATFASSNRVKQDVLVSGSKVNGTNLYAVATLLPSSGWALVPRLIIIMVIFAIALVLLGIAFGHWTLVPVEQAINYLTGQLDAVAHGRPVGYFTPGNMYLDPMKESVERLIAKEGATAPVFIQEATASQVETGKMGAYKEMSLGLAQALRDPLASVLAQAQLARAKSDREDLKEHFVVIERETRRARDTIEHLLRLTGEDRFPRTRLDIQDVALSTLAAQKNLLTSHNIRLVKEMGQTAPVSAHAGQLQTAIEEILKNAVESMSTSAEKQLNISTALDDFHVRLVITDTGVGLKAEAVGKVFDPFFTTKAAEQHKGLGLTVAKGIVKSLGGRLSLESAGEGMGTKVIIEFPIATATVRARTESGLIRTEILKGDLQKPLTGTQSDQLPAAPAFDEITMTGLKNGDMPPQGADGNEVTVRSPKVKESGS